MPDNKTNISSPSPCGEGRGGVELHNLIVGYRDTPVAGPLNATLREGELCCLLGPNGAGKSTLLRTLAAFQPPLSGSLLLNGKDIRRMPPRMLSTCIGIVLTDRITTQGLTARDLVAMGRSPYTNFWGQLTDEDNRLVSEAMEQVGVTPLAHRQVARLSDGERQKVMIAKALAQGTPVILLDEPTAFLDYPSKAETMLLLRRLCREMNKTILLSTHDLDLALQTADRLWLLNSESPAEELVRKPNSAFHVGTPQTLAASGTLSQFFQSPHVHFDPLTLRFSVTD